MSRLVFKTNLEYASDLASAIHKSPFQGTMGTLLRLYDCNSGEEFRVVEASVEDGIFCLDIERTGTISEAQ